MNLEENPINYNLVADNARRVYARTSLEAATKLGKYLVLSLNDGKYNNFDGMLAKLTRISILSDIPFGTLVAAVRTARVQKVTGFQPDNMRVLTPSHCNFLSVTDSESCVMWVERIETERVSVKRLQELIRTTRVADGGTQQARQQPKALKATRKIYKLLTDKTQWKDVKSMTVAERTELRKMLEEMEGHLQNLIVEAFQ